MGRRTSVATGRGCPYRCNFCSVWTFYGGRTRQMSARRAVDEVATIDTDHITFVDDNFLMNHRRENEIADRILSAGIRKRFSMECRVDSIVRHPELVAKWVEAGLYAVLLGLEGASDATLQSVNKKTTAASLSVAPETLSRVLRALRQMGLIEVGRQHIKVLDAEGLRAVRLKIFGSTMRFGRMPTGQAPVAEADIDVAHWFEDVGEGGDSEVPHWRSLADGAA